jgi:phosphoribosyl 1,2-cyclic phosphodiesterase
MKITLHGCRGSIAVSSNNFIKYGGNTSCYELRAGDTQIILDTGTGFQNVNFQKNYKKIILFSHLHHDHIQGLGFNSNIFNPDCNIEISSALCEPKELENKIQTYFSGSYFPLNLTDQLKNLQFQNFSTTIENNKDNILIESMEMNHPGRSFGYSITYQNRKVVYLSDNEVEPWQMTELYNFCEDSDIILWDGMFSDKELADKKGWGHSSVEQGANFFSKVKCKKMLITHHAPWHKDYELDQINSELPIGIELACDGATIEIN